MNRFRFTEEPIIAVLCEHEAGRGRLNWRASTHLCPSEYWPAIDTCCKA